MTVDQSPLTRGDSRDGDIKPLLDGIAEGEVLGVEDLAFYDAALDAQTGAPPVHSST
jgi:hypothetical protein